MKEILKVPEKRVDFNIFYLGEKRLIKLMLAGGEPWMCAKITALGIDVIEHQRQLQDSDSHLYRQTYKTFRETSMLLSLKQLADLRSLSISR